MAASESVFLVAPGTHVVGRADGVDLFLPVTGVSRRHARLHHGPEGLAVEDLGSRNGTYVNESPAAGQRLQCGDVVRFGPVEFLVEEIEAAEAELAVVLDPVPAASPPAASVTTVPLTWARCPEPPVIPPQVVAPEGFVGGGSAAMAELFKAMVPLFDGDLPVLIEGETGTGKELVARILHLSSPRRAGPFVAVNCAAIPADLLEAEMFGVAEGAATGVKARQGRLGEASGGTLLLDEVAELPLALQAKLLRVLQTKRVEPVGGCGRTVDVRVVSATNANLSCRVEQDRFRRDLYYRIAGAVLGVPPLRHRVEDIPALLESFVGRFAAASQKRIPGVTVKAVQLLCSYSWPGNVRELEHESQRLVQLCAEGRAIESTLLPKRITEAASCSEPAESSSLLLKERVRETERRAVAEALEQTRGNKRQAAQLLGISRNTLDAKIRLLDISV